LQQLFLHSFTLSSDKKHLILKPKIVIAGASGYIGQSLIPKLLEKFPNAEITALSRTPRYVRDKVASDNRIIWKSCDLFSLKVLEKSLPEQVDLAIYLLHSMGPTAQLDQGSFADYDLILADNFSMALRSRQLQQLIYLGALVPTCSALSPHLRSRLEVEQTFASYGFPKTLFRAGLIVGENGSSFQILLKLVTRLPLMICPRWTQSLTTPVGLDTVVNALVGSALANPHIGRTYDLAGCQPLSYMEMIQQTAQRLGKKRYIFGVPFFTPFLSKLWMTLITNTPKSLVYPLVESLQCPMIPRETHRYGEDVSHIHYSALLKDTPVNIISSQSLFHFQAHRKTVRSVQRLPLPLGKTALWVKDQYLQWLPKFLSPLLKVKVERNRVALSVLSHKIVLLKLKVSEERSTIDRQVLYIVGGLLVSPKNRGRFEFRTVLGGQFILAAIHEYQPALPWFIYKHSQAWLHLLIMKGFAYHLSRFKNAPTKSLSNKAFSGS